MQGLSHSEAAGFLSTRTLQNPAAHVCTSLKLSVYMFRDALHCGSSSHHMQKYRRGPFDEHCMRHLTTAGAQWCAYMHDACAAFLDLRRGFMEQVFSNCGVAGR